MSPDTLHPTGWFLGEVVDHGFNESKSGATQVFLKMRDNEEGHEITAFLSMSDKAIEHTVKKLRAAGFAGFDFDELRDGSLLRGNHVRYQVTHETYDGKVSAKVGWINDPNSSGVQRSDTAAQNARRFNAILKQNPPGMTTPKAAPKAAPAQQTLLNPNDVPF